MLRKSRRGAQPLLVNNSHILQGVSGTAAKQKPPRAHREEAPRLRCPPATILHVHLASVAHQRRFCTSTSPPLRTNDDFVRPPRLRYAAEAIWCIHLASPAQQKRFCASTSPLPPHRRNLLEPPRLCRPTATSCAFPSACFGQNQPVFVRHSPILAETGLGRPCSRFFGSMPTASRCGLTSWRLGPQPRRRCLGDGRRAERARRGRGGLRGSGVLRLRWRRR